MTAPWVVKSPLVDAPALATGSRTRAARMSPESGRSIEGGKGAGARSFLPRVMRPNPEESCESRQLEVSGDPISAEALSGSPLVPARGLPC